MPGKIYGGILKILMMLLNGVKNALIPEEKQVENNTKE